MINVSEQLTFTLKRKIFNNSDLENNSARQVLAELKTKQVDILTDITAEIQYKLLKKMLNDRITASDIYHNANRLDLAEKEDTESLVIKKFLSELEQELPKLMSKEEIILKIQYIINNTNNPNIGIIMKEFKSIQNVDKKLVSELAKQLLTGVYK